MSTQGEYMSPTNKGSFTKEAQEGLVAKRELESQLDVKVEDRQIAQRVQRLTDEISKITDPLLKDMFIGIRHAVTVGIHPTSAANVAAAWIHERTSTQITAINQVNSTLKDKVSTEENKIPF
jgi:hypothetical protein